MSTFTMNCPYCGDELEAETEWIGTPIKCPVCSKLFSIPIEMRKELGLETEKDTTEDQEGSESSGKAEIEIQTEEEAETEKTLSVQSFYFAGFMAKYSWIIVCVTMFFSLFFVYHLYKGYSSFANILNKEIDLKTTFTQKVEYQHEQAFTNMVWSAAATLLGSLLFSLLILSYGDICRKVQSITVEQDEQE